MVRVSGVRFPVTALGPGDRLGIWLQGCSIGCTGCMSRDTWDPAGGVESTVDHLGAIWDEVRAQGATGITISGGEPSEQPAALASLLQRLRAEAADVLVYTGQELAGFTAAVPGVQGLIDALITGPYDARRPTTLIWRGSANQTMHLLTELGRERFGRHVDDRPTRPPLQVVVDEHTIRYVGVPRAGDLARIDRDLRRSGIRTERSSWRP
jgi:anaerobic ribonucleoside-triphosphate reductase activating protein